MVAIVTGSGLGLGKSSAEVLGQGGQLGLGQLPGAAGNAYVNAATGNLIIQRQDELLIGLGPDIGVVQTYNSQGALDFDNNDNWQLALYRQISDLTGTVNTTSSTITRTSGDGTRSVYSYDAASGKYISKEGAGSYDTLSYNANTKVWTWQDGNSRVSESYNTADTTISGTSKWRVTTVADLDGKTLTYTYNNTTDNLITKVTGANGDYVELIYSTNGLKQLNQINTVSGGVTVTRVRYGYDSSNRLQTVTTDLTPTDNSVTDNVVYTTTYTYDGTSKRIASITNSDGSKVSFTYEQSGSFRLLTISDYTTNSSISATTTIAYPFGGMATITDANGVARALEYDGAGQLIALHGVNNTHQYYSYNANGDVVQVTDNRGSWTKYTYDIKGNQLSSQDNLGNTVTRTYGGNNQLLSQTVYTVPDANVSDAVLAASGAQTTQYVYSANGKNQLRFIISAEGQVTEYRYNSNGQVENTLQYAAGSYDVSTLANSLQDFSSNANGFVQSPLPAQYAFVNGALQVTSTRQASYAWTGINTPTKPLGTRFTAEIITQNLSASLLSAGITAGTWGAASYRRLWVTLEGSTLQLQVRNGGTALPIQNIGTVKANTTYVVEAVTESNGDSTLYFYEKGQPRETGYAGQLNLGTSDPSFALETVDSPGAASASVPTNTIRVDNLQIQMTPQESALATWAAQQDLTKLQRTDYTYDLLGQVSLQTVFTATNATTGAGIADGSQKTTKYVYDQFGNLLQKIDPRGTSTSGNATDYLTSYSYDGLNRFKLTTQYDATGLAGNAVSTQVTYADASRQIKLTLANGLVTTSTYDLAGRLITVQKSDSISTTAGSLGTTSYVYDKLGNLRMVTDAAGQNTYYLYDNANRKVGQIDQSKNLTEWVYNVNGQVIRTIQYKNTVTATLDATTALTNTLATTGVRNTDAANDRAAHKLYDVAGRLAKEIDALGYVTEYQYDGASRLLKTIQYANALNATQLNAINAASGELLPTDSNTVALADSTNDRVSRNLYDNDGKLVGTLDAEGYLTEYIYDKAGRQIQKNLYATATAVANRANGALSLLRSDATSVSADSTKHQTTNYIYNAAGQLTGVVDAENYLTEYQYDLVGNKTQEIRYATSITYVAGNTVIQSRPASNNEDQKITNTYDANNRILSTLSNTQGQVNGLLTNYTYDNVGNLTQAVKTFTGATSSQERVQRRQYDSRGNLIAELSGEGVVALLALGSTPTQAQIDTVWNSYGTRYTYDTADRLVSKLEPNGSNATGNKTLYYYDNEGKLRFTINALGEVSETVYNSFDQVAETRRYNTRIVSATLAGLSGGAENAVASAITGINAGGYSNIQVGYDKRGQTISTTDELNNINSRTYNAFGELNNRTDKIDSSTNVITSYQYDRKGLLKATTEDSADINRITSAIYDAFGRVTQTTDGRNNFTKYSYDRLGRTVTTTDALSQNTTVTYDAFDRKVSLLDARGNTTNWSYNATNRTMTMTTAENISVVTTVNTFGELVQVADGRGSITSYQYNADGQLIKTIEDSGAGKLNITTENIYDKAGRVYQSKDAKGTITQYNWDPINRVLSKTVDPSGLNLATRYRYDAQGRQIWTQDAKNIWTRMDYDKKGQLTKVIIDPASVPTNDANGVITGWSANAAGLSIVTSYTYDARGKKLTVIEGDGTTSARTTQYVYDKLGRLTSSIVDPGTNKLNLTTSYTYDKNDNVILKTDANSNKTAYTYDANNRLEYTVDALGFVERNFYDGNGNIVKTRAYKTALAPATLTALQAAPASTTVSVAEIGDDRVTRYGYDKDNRLTYTTNAEWFVTRNEYDANGNVVKRTNYINKATAISETGGAPTVTTNANDRIEQTVYDAANRATYSVDALNYVTANSYDANGNVVIATRYVTPMVGTLTTNTSPQILAAAGSGNYVITSSNDQTTRYSYDKANRRTFSMEANGSVKQYDYDTLGQTLKVTRYANAMVGTPAVGGAPTVTTAPGSGNYVLKDTTKDQVVEQKFDAAGRKTEAIDAEGKSTKTEYNAAGDIVKVTDALGNAGYYYTDAAGRVTLQVDPEGAVTQTQYDGLNNITQVLRFTGKVQTFGTGALNASAQIQVGGTPPSNGVYVATDVAKDQKQNIEYDKLGQTLFVKTWTGATDSTLSSAYYTDGYTYTAFGDVETQTARNGLVTTFTYDKQGRKTSESFAGITVRNAANNANITLKNSFTYNAFGNLLTKVEADGALTTRSTAYVNDKLGRQWQSTQSVQTTTGVSASAITQKTFDARGNIVAEKDANGNWTYTYYDKQDRRIASAKADGSYTVWEYDALGNISKETKYANKIQTSGTGTLSATSTIQPVGVAPGGNTVFVVTDTANDRITEYTYDKVGRQTGTKLSNITTGTYSATTQQYTVVTDNITTKTDYDALGNAIKQTDGNGNVTRSWYNKAGQLVAKLDSEGYLIIWDRDVYGNISKETRYATKPANAATNPLTVSDSTTLTQLLNTATTLGSTDDRITNIVYDKLNRVSTETVVNVLFGQVNAATGNLSDANGASATSGSVAVRKNVATSYQYDGLNNITKKTDATTAVTDWVYDGLGRELSIINPQFTDFEGNTARTRTDKEYDGLSNVTREIRRGRDNAVETDDQITTYTYGVGGRLISEKDATDAEIQYEYDLNGNVTQQKLIGRKDANNVSKDDITTYTFDSLNRQFKTKDQGTGVIQEVQYNSFNQITGKRTYTGATPVATRWDEYTQYDKAGKVWKSNSGDGVTKVYVNDKSGNTTVSISGTLNMNSMTLDQVLAQKELDQANNMPQQTLYTFSTYDKRNQLLTTVQPSMDGTSKDVTVVKITDTNQSLVVTSATAGSVTGGSGANPLSAGVLDMDTGIAQVSWASDLAVVGSEYYHQHVYINFPGDLGSGDGDIKVEYRFLVTGSYQGLGDGWKEYVAYVRPGVTGVSFYVNRGWGTGGHRAIYPVLNATLKISKKSSETDSYFVVNQTWTRTGWDNLAAYGAVQQADVNKSLYILSQPPTTSKLLLSYRPAGSNAAYTTVNVPQMVNTASAAMDGMYAFDRSGITPGNYEFQYVALDSSDNILNLQSGTFNTTNASALTISAQTPLSLGGAGRAFFSNTSVSGMGSGLQLINQGTDAASVTMRYRLKTSSGGWTDSTTSFVANNGFGTGSFVLDPAGLSGMTNGNDYDVEYVIKNSSGVVLRTTTGTIKKDSTGFSVVGDLQAPSKLTFTQPSTATKLSIRYKTLGSPEAYSNPIILDTVGNGKFEWDPNSLIPNLANTYDYDFDIEARNADGILVNHNKVDLRLGATTTQLASQNIALPQVLRIKPSQTGISYVRLSYRVKGSTANYTALNANVTASTNADTSTEYRFELPATLTAGDYEYSYTAYAADTVDANGDTVRNVLGSATGYFTAGSTGTASRLDWVIQTSTNVDDNAIKRSQTYNAFGEIVTETNGRDKVTTYTYNTLGAMTKKVAPTVSVTAENGAVNTNATPTTEYIYDAIGRVIAIKDANGNVNTQVWLAGSSAEGNITLEKHADGGVKAAGFDIFGNKRAEYDELTLAANRKFVAISALTNTELANRTDYTYDKENRLTKVERQKRNDTLTSRSTDQYTYDAAGNRISHINAANDTEKTFYDSLGRVTKTTSFMGLGFDTSYTYAYVNSIVGVGEATVSGWQKTTTDATGRTLIDKTDMFNHVTWHQDLGGRQFTYVYNQAGWLTSQTSLGSGAQFSGQNIAYEYYNNGNIKAIHDKAVGMYTYYEYDKDGNRTFEGYISLKDAGNFAAGAKDYYQYARIEYDAMNRMTKMTDPKAIINYEYDAVGNRRMVTSEYYDGADGSKQTQTYWYKYDSMNRFLITMGSLSGARGGTSTITQGSTGVNITYNLTGQRTQAINGGDGTTEGYSYTNDGYLTNVTINGALGSKRTNDALGRVIKYEEFGGNASAKNIEYDKDNRVTRETGSNGTTDYWYYNDKNAVDAQGKPTYSSNGVGELAYTRNVNGTQVETFYAYEYWDDAKQFAITNAGYNAALGRNNQAWKSGYSELTYDVNGHLIGANDAGSDGNRNTADDRRFRYVNDAQGLILFRDEVAGTSVNRRQRYYYVDGKRVGDVGNDGDVRTDYVQAMANRGNSKTDYKNFKPISSADFDQNYEPISPNYPGFAATAYTVKNGDTLQSIARAVWGDADMWYLIADANGLTSGSTLTAGQVLTIPNKVTNIHNNSGTYRVYNPGEAIGDVNPTLPTAPPPPKKKKGGCGGFATLIVAVVAVVAAVYLGPLVAGALGAPAGTATAMISAGVGSIAGQVAGNALGVQQGFDFKSFGIAIATAGIGSELMGASAANPSGALGKAIQSSFGSGYAAIAARAVVGNVIGQGIGNITGAQKGFSWSSVAIAGIGATAAAFATNQMGLTQFDAQGQIQPRDTALGTDFGIAVVNNGAFALTQLVVKGGKVNWQQVATDTITDLIQSRVQSNAIEKSLIAESAVQQKSNKQAEAQRNMVADASKYTQSTMSDALTPEEEVRFGQIQESKNKLSEGNVNENGGKEFADYWARKDERILQQAITPDSENYLARFGKGIYEGAKAVVTEPFLQVYDLGVAFTSVVYNETTEALTGKNPLWFPQTYSGISKAYANGASQFRLLAQSNPITGVGVLSYDMTTSAINGQWGDVTEQAGGLFAGLVLGKAVSKYGSWTQAAVPLPGQRNFIGPLTPLTELNEVAGFVSENGQLPKNFINKETAKSMGWNSKEGNLDQVAKSMSIGGDIYHNRGGLLPSAPNRIWYEGDINYKGGHRGGERILYSNDGMIYSTIDHYKTVTRIK